MIKSHIRVLWGIFLMSCVCSGAKAGEGNDSQYFEEFPVVLTASRLKQPMSEAPSAMTVIDAEMIKAAGSRTIPEILRLVPGMYIGYASGNTPIVSYHGAPEMYTRRMQVLVDGRSIYMQPFVGVTWTDIPVNIDDIERIEVVRGPAAASYGANSLQGVINIITKDPAYTHNRVSTNQGNGGISDISARLTQQLENLSYRFTVSQHEDQGFDFAKMNDGSRALQLNFKGDYQLNNENYLDMQLGYSDTALSQGFIEQPFNIRDPLRTITSISDFQQIEWHHTPSSDSELKVSYHHTARNYQDSADPKNIDNFQSHRHELGFQHTFNLNESNRVVWGGNLRYESTATTILFQPAKSLQGKQLFVNDEWRLNPSFLLNAGAMLEDDGWGNRRGSPRIALNYHATPTQTFRVGTSVAYRTPSMVEYGANSTYLPNTNNNLVGNPNLRPEKVISREIGYLGEFRDLGLSLDARIYEDRISDFTFIDPTVRFSPNPMELVWGFANLFAVKYQGIESTLKYSWNQAGNLTLNFSHQRASCAITGQLDPTIGQLDPARALKNNQAFQVLCQNDYGMTVPSDSGSLLLTQKFSERITASAAYYQQEPTQILLSWQPQNRMRRVDMRLGYEFGHRGRPGAGEIALTLQNAFQDNYTQYVDFSQKVGFIGNRRAWVTGSMEF